MSDLGFFLGVAIVVLAVMVAGNNHAAVETCKEQDGVPITNFMQVGCKFKEEK